MRATQLRAPLLGDGVPAAQTIQKRHRTADVPETECGKRAPHQETALRSGLYYCRGAPAVAGRGQAQASPITFQPPDGQPNGAETGASGPEGDTGHPQL